MYLVVVGTTWWCICLIGDSGIFVVGGSGDSGGVFVVNEDSEGDGTLVGVGKGLP